MQANFDITEIIGNKEKITFSTFNTKPILLENTGGIQHFQIDNPLHIQQPFIQTIVDDLNGTGKCPGSGESGSRTNWIMDNIYKI